MGVEEDEMYELPNKKSIVYEKFAWLNTNFLPNYGRILEIF